MSYSTKITEFFDRPVASTSLSISVFGLITFLILVWIFPPFFSVNDDPYRAMIVAGQGIAAQPDAQLAYSNFLLGVILRSLYRSLPDFNWYGFFLLSCHALSYLVILHVLLKSKLTRLESLFVYILVTDVLLMYFALFNYTSTAFYLGLAAGSLAISNCFNQKQEWFSAAILLLICFLIRKEVFYLVMVILSFSVAYLTYIRNKSIKKLSKPILLFLLLATFTTGLRVQDQKLSEEIPGNRWNGVHMVLVEWYNYGKVIYNETTKPYFATVGWKEIDYRILMSPFMLWNVFDLDSLKKVEAQTMIGSTFDITRGLFLLSNTLFSKGTLVVLFWSFLSFLFFQGTSGKSLVSLSIGFAWLAIVLLLVGARLKMAAYVSLPVFSFFTLISLLIGKESREQVSSFFKLSCFALLFVATLWGIKAHYGINRFRLEMEREYQTALLEINPKPQELYVAWGPDLPVQLPRVMSQNLYSSFKIICTGWPLYTRVAAERLKEFGIENLYQALYEKENVYLIADKAREEDLKEFLKSHYGVEIKFETHSTSKLFTVFKVRRG